MPGLTEVPGYGTAVTVEVARRLDVPWLRLVVNKVLPCYEECAIREQVEGTYGATVAGIIPESDDMLRLGSSDVFCLCYPEHPLTGRVREIATQLLG